MVVMRVMRVLMSGRLCMGIKKVYMDVRTFFSFGKMFLLVFVFNYMCWEEEKAKK